MVYAQRTIADGYKEISYPMYRCSDEDYEHFHTTESLAQQKLKILRNASELFCFNWKKANFAIYGNWASDAEYGAAEIVIYPCESRWTAHDGSIHGGGEHCAHDKKETEKYLGGAFNLILLYNHGSFN